MIQLLATAASVLSPYFTPSPTEFSTIGKVVQLLIAQESDPQQLIIKKVGSTITLLKGDGTVDAAGHVSVEESYTSALPEGSTKRYNWAGVVSAAAYPAADTPMSLEQLVNQVVENDLTDGYFLTIDQSRGTVAVNDEDTLFDGKSDEVATFLDEGSLKWE